ncbi:hypothetical protein ABT093_38215 [Kitasatospora sp. NPDC002551]|uniref:hypothetical protein n=1 Tax=Kitasatospora sp. NPDC002551 TaxID=3154539 RepID=UPI00332B1BF8
MTEQSDGGGDNFVATLLWLLLGFVAGFALSTKVVIALEIPLGEQSTLNERLLIVALFVGPAFLLVSISNHLERWAARGNFSWARYWTAMFSVAVTVLTLLGMNSVDDLIALADAWKAYNEQRPR